MSDYARKIGAVAGLGISVAFCIALGAWNEQRIVDRAVAATRVDAGGFKIGSSSQVAPSTTNEVLIADRAKIRWMYEDRTLAWCEQPKGLDANWSTCATPVYCGECVPLDGSAP